MLSSYNGSRENRQQAKNFNFRFCFSLSLHLKKRRSWSLTFSAHLNPSATLNLPTVPDVPNSLGKRDKFRNTLLILNTNKASFHRILELLLKSCAPELLQVMSKLLQLSYNFRTFPNGWKNARVQPIHKKVHKTEAFN